MPVYNVWIQVEVENEDEGSYENVTEPDKIFTTGNQEVAEQAQAALRDLCTALTPPVVKTEVEETLQHLTSLIADLLPDQGNNGQQNDQD